MPYYVNWYDDEHSILRITADGVVTWDEYHAVYDEARLLVTASPRRVDVIADPENRMPPGNPLPHFGQLISKWSGVKNFGNLYVVRNSRLNGFIQSAAGIAGMMTRTPIAERVVFVATLGEALNQIRDDRGENNDIRESNQHGGR
jgi:hypothetical protein